MRETRCHRPTDRPIGGGRWAKREKKKESEKKRERDKQLLSQVSQRRCTMLSFVATSATPVAHPRPFSSPVPLGEVHGAFLRSDLHGDTIPYGAPRWNLTTRVYPSALTRRAESSAFVSNRRAFPSLLLSFRSARKFDRSTRIARIFSLFRIADVLQPRPTYTSVNEAKTNVGATTADVGPTAAKTTRER